MQNYKDNIKLFLDKNCNFWVSLQRRLYPNFQYFHLWKTKLGRIFFVDGVYTLNISDLSVGWRANHEKAGGWALLDMWYHMIDILIRFFWMPKQVFCSTMSWNRIWQYYDVEDSVILHMSYDNNMLCRFFISRIWYKKQESITIYGEYGYILLEKDSIKLFGISGELVDFYSFELEKIEIYKEQLSLIAKQLDSWLYCGKQNYENFYFHSQLIDKLYTSAHFKKIIYI